MLSAGTAPLAIGGDHSVSWPLVAALHSFRARSVTASRELRPLTLLHFDAHSDLYESVDFGLNEGQTRQSHASPFARILEEGLVDSLVTVGVRTLTEGCRAQLEAFGGRATALEARNWPQSRENVQAFIEMKIPCSSDVYISFDLDVLDPAYAPAVSHLEPGGISTRQALDMLLCLGGRTDHEGSANLPNSNVVSSRRRVVMADLVEFNPRHDLVLGVGEPGMPRQGLGAMAAAKIAKELLGLLTQPLEAV